MPLRPVFVHGKTVAFRCPKSMTTALSLTLLEQFLYWKRFGGDIWSWDAKTADAILALEQESLKEIKNEQK